MHRDSVIYPHMPLISDKYKATTEKQPIHVYKEIDPYREPTMYIKLNEFEKRALK